MAKQCTVDAAMNYMAHQRTVVSEFDRLKVVATNASVKEIFGFYHETPNLSEVSLVYRRMSQELRTAVGGAHNEVAVGERFGIFKRVFKKVVAAVKDTRKLSGSWTRQNAVWMTRCCLRCRRHRCRTNSKITKWTKRMQKTTATTAMTTFTRNQPPTPSCAA